jgi:DNA polymerase-3 subunit alpha
MSFTHLHLHTTYSIGDSITQIDPLFDKIKRINQNAVAITDHGNMFGAVVFYKQAIKNGIKPIIGCEMYMANGRMTDKNGEKGKKGYGHLVLLAQNQQGYKNLIKLCSLGYTEGFYYKPRIDKDTLYQYKDGLICLSACLAGTIQQYVINNRIEQAIEEIQWYHKVFENNFYLEIQNHHIAKEGLVRDFFKNISMQYGIPLVATNDSHYIEKEDNESHDIMLCINSGSKRSDENRRKYDGYSYHVTTEQEMNELFPNFADAVQRTQEIADKVDFQMDFKTHHFPKCDVPPEYTLDNYLEKKVYDGANKIFNGNITTEIKTRIETELAVIKQCGFSEYFLLVHDFVKWAKDRGIAVGPGRGCICDYTRIYMADGTACNINNIKIGNNIITKDGSIQEVEELFEYEIEEDIINIKSYYGDYDGIGLTTDHEIWAEKTVLNNKYMKWDKHKKKKDWKKYLEPIGKLDWIKSKDLNVGDWIFTPIPQIKKEHIDKFDLVDNLLNRERNDIKYDNKYIYEYNYNALTKRYHLVRKVERYIECNKDFIWAIGLFTMDGWLRKSSDVEVGFAFNSDTELKNIDKIINLGKSFGCNIRTHRHKTKKVFEVFWSSKSLCAFFRKNFNLYKMSSVTKHIPSFIFKIENDLIYSYIDGLLNADGNYGDYKNVLSTSSLLLSDQIRFLCNIVQIPTTRTLDNRIDKREDFKNSKLSYRINIGLDKDIGGNSCKSRYVYRYVNGGILTRIRKKTIEHKKCKVYDIKVKNNHNYLTTSGIVHNSGAGSMVVYCLYITEVNPLEYGLFFERFLNPERVSMPDIDIDFCYFRRQEVINYVIEKYGKENVSNIITFGFLKGKSAVNAVAKVLGIQFMESQKISKMILLPNESLETNLQANTELKNILESSEANKELLKICRTLEGCIKYSGTHASGVVIASGRIDSYVPLSVDKDGQLATQYDMESVDAAGMLKVDFLGLRTMTVINETIRLIKERKGTSIVVSNIPLDDPKVYKLLANGDTSGVFQLESHGMQKLLAKMGLKDNNFRDLIALVALYRPGPLQSGMVDKFIARKKGDESVSYIHHDMENILRETYGVIVYQEQIMQIAVKLCGFTMGRGDVLRKAMGKKKKEVMDAMREEFVDGGIKTSGLPKVVMTQLFDEIEKFAAYGFNKSHSLCYAFLSYVTAWLKVNYTVEFMASLLTSVVDKEDKVQEYFVEAKRLNIPILLPDINESYRGFEVTGNGEIRYGIGAVRNVGDVAVDNILEDRKINGIYSTLENFCSRVKVSKKIVESLIKSGCFDRIANRPQLLNIAPKVVDIGKKLIAEKDQDSLLDFIDEEDDDLNDFKVSLPNIPDCDVQEKGKMEREVLGVSISYNALDIARGLFSKYITVKASNIEDYIGQRIELPFVVIESKAKTYSKGTMLYLDLMDDSGTISAIAFDKTREMHGDKLIAGNIVIVTGRVDFNNDKAQIIIDNVRLPEQSELESGGYFTIDINNKNRLEMEKLRNLINCNRGNDYPLRFMVNGSYVLTKIKISKNNSLITDIKLLGFNVVEGF